MSTDLENQKKLPLGERSPQLKTYNAIRPGTWVKAALLTFLGVFLTRLSIGIGWLKWNMILGPISILCMAVCWLLWTTLILHRIDEDIGYTKIRVVEGVAIFFNLLALGIYLYQLIVYNIGIFPLFLLLIATVFPGIFVLFKKEGKADILIHPLAVSLILMIGILYGGSLNFNFPPLYLLLIGIGIGSLQFLKELIKALRLAPMSDNNRYQHLIHYIGPKKVQTTIKVLEISVIICLGVVSFFPLPNQFLYVLTWGLIALIMVGAVIISFQKNLEKKKYHILHVLVKISIFLVFVMLFLGSV